MPTYIGYSSLNTNRGRDIARNATGTPALSTNQYKNGRGTNKFTLTDENLVIADLINALNIKQGEKVGQPEYGTTIWSYIFEPNTASVRTELENEIRRVIGTDPRIILNNVSVYSYENGVQFEVELAVSGYNKPLNLQLDLNRTTGRARSV